MFFLIWYRCLFFIYLFWYYHALFFDTFSIMIWTMTSLVFRRILIACVSGWSFHRWGATLMNSFLFNVGLILLCSIRLVSPIVSFLTCTFKVELLLISSNVGAGDDCFELGILFKAGLMNHFSTKLLNVLLCF